jgi:pimeloyl-ACP methyl ester carboxylesterase
MNERVVQFGDGTCLVGVLSEPDGAASAVRLPAVVLLNAGTLHRIGPHRVYVRIARSLAQEGFAVLRFDLSGLGDSPPRSDNLPYVLSTIRETREAMDCVTRETGAQEFVLAGLCGGADLAFRVARDDARVVGVGLLDWYAYGTAKSRVRRYLLPLLHRQGWGRLLLAQGPVGARLWSWLGRRPVMGGRVMNDVGLPPKDETAATLRALMGRGGHLLCVYTGALGVYNYRDQFADAFRSIPFGDRLRVDFHPHADHTLTLLHYQRRLVEVVRDWAVQAWVVKRHAQMSLVSCLIALEESRL